MSGIVKLVLLGLALGVAILLVMLMPEDAAMGTCCQVGADSCASGPTVTQEYCELELDGSWVAGACNTATGVCE